MGRAVMVGRGPTGAGALFLSILIILTADGCRAQKGWWHGCRDTWGGGMGDRVEPRLRAATRRFTVRLQAWRSWMMRSGSARCCCAISVKPALHGRVYVENRSASTACRRPSRFLFNGVKPVEPVEKEPRLWSVNCNLVVQSLPELTCCSKEMVSSESLEFKQIPR